MSNLIDSTGNYWLLISFIAPMLWAIVNVIDVYFVDDIYQNEYDGAIISGLFQVLPWFFLVFLVDFQLILSPATLLAFFGGIFFAVSFYFYFKALFSHNDVATVQILWNLCVVVVPVLAFFLLKERLSIIQYLGIAITLIGATILSRGANAQGRGSVKFYVAMGSAISLLSLSMVCEDKAYSELNLAIGDFSFWTGFLFFSVGACTGGILLSIIGKRNPFPFIKKYFAIFFMAELLSFFGTLASQRAIDISPSVSFVSTIESFTPAFVLIYSALYLVYYRHVLRTNNEIGEKIYQEQICDWRRKALATLIMATGVYFIT